MVNLNSLSETPHLSDVFRLFPRGVEPLLKFHDVLLRGESPLTVSEREMIAAFVSGLNGCEFCFGAHSRIAQSYGVDPSLFEQLLENLESAPIRESLKPILRYVRVLTLSPAKMTQKLIEDIYLAGWEDQAIYDAASICGLFSFMNRIVEGMGVSASHSVMKISQSNIKDSSYQDFGRNIGVID